MCGMPQIACVCVCYFDGWCVLCSVLVQIETVVRLQILPICLHFFNSSLSIPNYRPYPSSHSSFASTNHWHLDASSVFAIGTLYNLQCLTNMIGQHEGQCDPANPGQIKQKQNCVNWILVNPKRHRKSQKHTHQK